MWNVWTGFLPFGITIAVVSLGLALMVILYAIGSLMIWQDEIKEEAEKKRKRQEARKAELGRKKTSARRAV